MAEIRTKFGIFTKTYADQLKWAENLYKNKTKGKTKSNFSMEEVFKYPEVPLSQMKQLLVIEIMWAKLK